MAAIIKSRPDGFCVMLRVVKVYGELAKFLGQREFEAAVASPAEAMRFLLANFPGLRAHMAEQHYEVRVGKRALPIGEDPEHLHHPVGKEEVITFKPVVVGAGAAGGRIAIGAALVAFSLLAGPLGAFSTTLYGPFASGLSVTTGFQLGSTAAALIGSVGVGLALSGVSQLMAPTPQIQAGQNSEKDPRKSYSFSGVQNTSRQGLPVPVIYGEVIVGSIVVSAGIDIQQVEVEA